MSTPVRPLRPQFSSLEDAMTFAFYNWHAYSETVEEPSVSQFIGKNQREQIDEGKDKQRARRIFGVDTDRLPEGYDAGGQAGLLVGFIMRLPEPEQSHIKARFLLERQRDKAKELLLDVLLATLPTGVHKRRLLWDLVSRFYGKSGEDMTNQALMKRHKAGRYEFDCMNRHVYITLSSVAHRAETRVYDYLQERGVIA